MDCQRALFDIPEGITYLNCAYQSPKLLRSLEAAERASRRSARPWEFTPDDFFAPAEALRGRFARLIDASPDDIAIVPSAGYGIATAAANLPCGEGRRVVTLAEQFPSNVYAWRENCRANGGTVHVVERPPEGDWTDDIAAAIDAHCAVAALPQVHWTDGYRIDLDRIARRCHEMGAALVLDLTQSLGAVPFSVRDVDADFIAVSAYKWLLGPLGLGLLYVNPRHHHGRAIEQNWIARAGSQDFARLVDYTDEFQPGARRYDAGGRTNAALLALANTALEQILVWGLPRISDHVAGLTGALAGAAETAGLRCTPASNRPPHLFGIELPEERLADTVRLLAAGNIHASVRGNKLRVAPFVYNSREDIDRLIDVMQRL